MSKFMIGAFCCAVVTTILLMVSMLTNYWIKSGDVQMGPWNEEIEHSITKSTEETVAKGFCVSIRVFIVMSVILSILGLLSFAPFFSRINRGCARGIMFFLSTFCAFLAMAVFTGMKGMYFGPWDFSWGYIMGWIALILTFSAGILTRYVFKEEA